MHKAPGVASNKKWCLPETNSHDFSGSLKKARDVSVLFISQEGVGELAEGLTIRWERICTIPNTLKSHFVEPVDEKTITVCDHSSHRLSRKFTISK